MVSATDNLTTGTGVEEIQGTVAQLFFSKASFCAGRLRSKGRDISFSVKGYVKLGEPVTLRGKWVNNAKYGRQFEAVEVVYTLPADPQGLAKWLEWYVPCVGAVKAQILIDEYGLDLPIIAAQDPQQVAIHGHIHIDSIHRIAESWKEYGAKVAAFSELASFGLTQHQTEVLWAKFKGSAGTILREDPYLLLREVDGFGFKTVDEIARKLGYPESHPGRKRAAYITAVVDAESEGSTAIREAVAVEAACGMIDLPVEEYGKAVLEHAERAAAINHVRRIETTDGSSNFYVGLPAPHRHEELLWKTFTKAADANPHYARAGPAEFIAENYGGIGDKRLDDDQIAAVVSAVKHRITFVTGGAGSGKTLVARAITKVFADADITIHLCAPTGKAARRMEDVIGREASTIHRLLGFRGNGFERDQNNPLPDGLVIVDEMSMVDSSLAYHLFRAISPKTSVVCIGDPNQLPPVGAGAVLRDVLANGLAPVARLRHCHRQAGPLKSNCAAILAGKVEPSHMETDDPNGAAPWMVHDALTTEKQVVRAVTVLFEKYLPAWGYDPIRDTQILTAKHGGELGTRYLNRICQRLHQKRLGVELDEPDIGDESRPVLYVGDKIIHIKNNYILGVMNGTQGVVMETGGKFTVVKYDEKEVSYTAENKGEIELAYVITPHKAQGSEWPCAVVVCHRTNKYMQTRAWLYTAATRAQRTCVVIGDEPSIRRAAENNRRDARGTWLEVFSGYENTRPR